jgi:hypothetical protein
VVVYDVFDIAEDLSVSTLGHAGLLLDGLTLWLENSGRLGV